MKNPFVLDPPASLHAFVVFGPTLSHRTRRISRGQTCIVGPLLCFSRARDDFNDEPHAHHSFK
jgi:hypothetical protein